MNTWTSPPIQPQGRLYVYCFEVACAWNVCVSVRELEFQWESNFEQLLADRKAFTLKINRRSSSCRIPLPSFLCSFVALEAIGLAAHLFCSHTSLLLSYNVWHSFPVSHASLIKLIIWCVKHPGIFIIPKYCRMKGISSARLKTFFLRQCNFIPKTMQRVSNPALEAVTPSSYTSNDATTSMVWIWYIFKRGSSVMHSLYSVNTHANTETHTIHISKSAPIYATHFMDR